jgi:hypothetical protein
VFLRPQWLAAREFFERQASITVDIGRASTSRHRFVSSVWFWVTARNRTPSETNSWMERAVGHATAASLARIGCFPNESNILKALNLQRRSILVAGLGYGPYCFTCMASGRKPIRYFREPPGPPSARARSRRSTALEAGGRLFELLPWHNGMNRIGQRVLTVQLPGLTP